MALVLGEAYESDEEICNKDITLKPATFATEVFGEATESDDDMYETNSKGIKKSMDISFYVNNLLQRKLIDTNVSLWNHLPQLIKNVANTASKQVLYTDQLLIKSQVSIQSAISSLKEARANIEQVHAKYEHLFSTNFIPTIYRQTEDQLNAFV